MCLTLFPMEYKWILFFVVVWFDSLRPSLQFSVTSGQIFLGWTSTKQGLISCSRTQHSEARTHNPSIWETSTLPHQLHFAWKCDLMQNIVRFMVLIINIRQDIVGGMIRNYFPMEMLRLCHFSLFVWFVSLRPINNLSVKQRRVFLSWTSTKLG